jgi:hypothetical protein
MKRLEAWRLGWLETAAQTKPVPSYMLAIQSAAAGVKEKAFAWLEKAFQDRDAGLVMFQAEQIWDALAVHV